MFQLRSANGVIMESLALVVAIIVAPAMFGGPIALLLALWRSDRIGSNRRYVIYFLSALSLLVGIYLVVGSISKGATLIGILGIVTGAAATWRARKRIGNF